MVAQRLVSHPSFMTAHSVGQLSARVSTLLPILVGWSVGGLKPYFGSVSEALPFTGYCCLPAGISLYLTGRFGIWLSDWDWLSGIAAFRWAEAAAGPVRQLLGDLWLHVTGAAVFTVRS